MGLLSEFITDQDLAFDETKTTDVKKYKRGTLSDIGTGAVSGVAKGVLSVSNGLSRIVEGDEVADKRLHQVNEALTPRGQGTAGHITSGITEVVSAGVVGAPLGPVGVATTVGIGSRASEHTRLTQQLGVDQDTADTASNIYGATNAVLAGLPVANVFKTSALLDYGALVVAPTLAGQGMTYVEGDYLENKGYKKQGEQYKEMATDPTVVWTNFGIGSAFFALGRLRADPNATQQQVHEAELKTYEAVDQAIAEVDMQNAPTDAKSVTDLMQHEANINKAIEDVMSGKKVNISEATGGQLKTLDDVKNHIQATKTKQPTLDELSAKIAANISARLTSNKNNTTINSPTNTTKNTFNIKAPVSQDQNTRIQDSFSAAQQAGFTPAQAKALVGELGRENDFNIKTMFGFHKDQANHKQNGGIFSWQGTRAAALANHMQSKGLVNADGTFKRTNEAIVEQFAFLKHEIESNPKWKASFLDKKNITNAEARSALGGKGTIIGWARGQTKLKSGDAFDWQAHEARANKYSNMVDGELTVSHVIDDAVEATDLTALPVKDLSNLDGTVHRTDLDTFPDLTLDFISPHDLNAFGHRNADHEVVGDVTTEQLDFPIMVLDENGNVVPESEFVSFKQLSKADTEDLSKFLEGLTETIEQTPVPHTAKGIRVKGDIMNPNKEFKPDSSITTEWKEHQRYEDGKYHKELTRTFKDKDGKTVQELRYRGSYVRRTIDPAHKTDFIHVGRLNSSDFKNHKGNKELETALDRIFDEGRAFGYLSQIPKGQQTIDKLIANPNLVISSKKTGEDLTAQQWKDKLIREQDNIQMMAKAMSTLAKCALKQTS